MTAESVLRFEASFKGEFLYCAKIDAWFRLVKGVWQRDGLFVADETINVMRKRRKESRIHSLLGERDEVLLWCEGSGAHEALELLRYRLSVSLGVLRALSNVEHCALPPAPRTLTPEQEAAGKRILAKIAAKANL